MELPLPSRARQLLAGQREAGPVSPARLARRADGSFRAPPALMTRSGSATAGRLVCCSVGLRVAGRGRGLPSKPRSHSQRISNSGTNHEPEALPASDAQAPDAVVAQGIPATQPVRRTVGAVLRSTKGAEVDHEQGSPGEVRRAENLAARRPP